MTRVAGYDRRVQLRFALPILVALAGALGSCGGGSDERRSTQHESTARTDTAPTSTARGSESSGRRRHERSGFEEVQEKHPQLPALSGG
jgi:hypothetical protein